MQHSQARLFLPRLPFPSQILVPYLHSIYVASCLSCYLSTWHKSNYFIAKAAAAGKVKKKKKTPEKTQKTKPTLTPVQNRINNYLSGDMGNYAHSLPPSSLSGEDSKGNILPLCGGKRSFLSKVVFADAHNAGYSPRTPRLTRNYQHSINSQCTACKADRRQLPAESPSRRALSLSCQSKQ